MGDLPTGQITLGRYLWTRIHQIGCTTIFGVPGDFNLQFLDSIFLTPGLKWCGNQNELNAAYAADGYARVKGVPGCVVTTHGVGELSALNGIAGSMSEHVKVIHVVGQTTKAMQERKMMIHHSIGNEPDHQVYQRASKGLRFDAAELWDLESAPAEIDRVIRECFLKSGPVYIFLPLDLSSEMVDASLLETPINTLPDVDEIAEKEAVKAVVEAIKEAKRPTLLVDAWTQRFGASKEAGALVKRLGVPFFSANMGKGVVDETDEMYVGVWNGAVSAPGVEAVAKAADLVITLGYIPADTNAAGFSRKISDSTAIHIDPHSVVVKSKTFSNTSIKSILAAITSALPSTPQHSIPKPNLPPPRTPLDKDQTKLTQSFLWPSIESFLQPNDVIISETGTSNFGLCDISFPSNTQFITQIYYGSIGFATAATLGADIARRELRGMTAHHKEQGRTLLFTGDGSFALTMQELGTMIKSGSKAVIFLLNNKGYTIERLIWGAQQAYNDIVPANYSYLLPLFCHPSPDSAYHKVTTKEELTKVLASKEVRAPENLQIVELVLDKLDTSWRLGTQLAWRSEEHRKYLTDEGFVDTYGGWGLDGVAGGDVKWS